MAYLRMEEVQQGKSAAANAAKYAKTDDQASYAARLLASIADYEAAMAAAKERAAQATAAAASAAAAAVTASPATDAVPAPPAIEAAPFSPGTGRGSQPWSVTVNGRIRNMICSSDAPVIEVATATGVLRLLIDNPLAITVQGTPAGTVDLSCGSQDAPIRIGYVPLIDSTRKTVGNVRLLDYQPR